MYPIIIDKYKIIFFYSPKCGCSSLKKYCIAICPKYSTIEKNVTIEPHNFVDVDTLKVHKVITADPIDSLERYKFYKKILISRDPYERSVSAFIYVMHYFEINKKINCDNDDFSKHFLENLCGSDNSCSNLYPLIIEFKMLPSFRNFIKILNAINIEKADPHISPQSHCYCSCNITKNDLDEIVDLKKLNERLKKLNEELNVDCLVENINATHHSEKSINMCDIDIVEYGKINNNVYPKWIYFYDKDIKKMVYNIYKSDFNLLNQVG